MVIQRFCEASALSWDRFVDRSLNGTFMHSRRFLSYHPPQRFHDHSVQAVDDRGEIEAVFPAAVVAGDGGPWWQSHPGASCGGPAVDDRISGPRYDELLGHLVEYAAAQGFAGIRMRLPEDVFCDNAPDEFASALFRLGFHLEARELSSAVTLADFTDDVADGLPPGARSKVRKAAAAGVVVRTTDDFESFWPILENNLRARHAVQPTHTLAEIRLLRELLGERVVLVGAYLRDELMAGVVLFRLNRRAAHVMYMAQNYDHQLLRPLNLAVYHAIVECRSRRHAYLNFGMSSIPGTSGREMNWGLHAFKTRSGGRGVVRDTWSLALGDRSRRGPSS